MVSDHYLRYRMKSKYIDLFYISFSWYIHDDDMSMGFKASKLAVYRTIEFALQTTFAIFV